MSSLNNALSPLKTQINFYVQLLQAEVGANNGALPSECWMGMAQINGYSNKEQLSTTLRRGQKGEKENEKKIKRESGEKPYQLVINLLWPHTATD